MQCITLPGTACHKNWPNEWIRTAYIFSHVGHNREVRLNWTSLALETNGHTTGRAKQVCMLHEFISAEIMVTKCEARFNMLPVLRNCRTTRFRNTQTEALEHQPLGWVDLVQF